VELHAIRRIMGVSTGLDSSAINSEINRIAVAAAAVIGGLF
jgi:hypothetical protein